MTVDLDTVYARSGLVYWRSSLDERLVQLPIRAQQLLGMEELAAALGRSDVADMLRVHRKHVESQIEIDRRVAAWAAENPETPSMAPPV